MIQHRIVILIKYSMIGESRQGDILREQAGIPALQRIYATKLPLFMLFDKH